MDNGSVRILMPPSWLVNNVQARSPRIIGALTSAGFNLERDVWVNDNHSDGVFMPNGDIPTLVATTGFSVRPKLRQEAFCLGYLVLCDDVIRIPDRVITEDPEILFVLKVFLADYGIVRGIRLPPRPTGEFGGFRGQQPRRR